MPPSSAIGSQSSKPPSTPASNDYFATCPKGLESLLLQELQSMGAGDCKETVAGVAFAGDLQLGYRSCLWSRLANRILLPIASIECRTVEDLYRGVASIDWEQHLSIDKTFAIAFSGKLAGIQHSHFGALKAKDAIADYFNLRYQRRPDVESRQPDVLINVRVNKGVLIVSIDLSGDSLHRRGYRQSGGSAPLKENLAAAILLRADWPAMASRGGALLDPMCGSGTLLIEGAMMMAHIAPGLMRSHWGFFGWSGHRQSIWRDLVEEATAARDRAMQRQWPEIRGYDASPRALENAQENIDRAGLSGRIRVARKELARFTKPTHSTIDTGLVITNPPYGERLGDADALLHLYRYLGQTLKREFPGWRAGVFTGNPELGKKMGLRSNKQYQLFNGTIPSKLLLFDVEPQYFVQDHSPLESGKSEQKNDSVEPLLSAGATMFANRLRKNLKQLSKWVSRESISCYRLYDADMPEYSVAVDRYNDWIHVAEYAPPAKVDPQMAGQRLADVLAAIPTVLDISPRQLVLKQRSRQRGSNQYQKVDEANQLMEVREGQARLLVNLFDYLDTGLFLDHRPVRLKIAELAKGQRFLNLFCYTATASVHAALGGATFSDSVDLSATYLDWAKKNFALNGFSDTQHRTIRADVMEWIQHCDNIYDLILLDPPTFSNSKKMDATLDIQRDHVKLIQRAMARLSVDGLLIFSNNHRKFKLDSSLLVDFAVDDRTDWSLDKDFQHSKKIHQCWFIRHR